MSATNYYQPHIYLTGRKLPEGADFTRYMVPAAFTIKWGATEWYGLVEPAELTMTLLDPYGRFLDTGGVGAALRITRDPDARTLFLGRVTDVASRLVKLTPPGSGVPRDVWEHTVTANDPLGIMARDRRRGGVWPSREGPGGQRMHWGPCYMSERKTDLDRRAPAPIAWEPTVLDQWDGQTVVMHPVAAYERQQVVSALTVLRQTARISSILNRPYYYPHDDQIRLVRPPTSSPELSIQWTGFARGIRVLAPGSDDVLLDGDDFSSPDGITASTSDSEQATRVEVSMRSVHLDSKTVNAERTLVTEEFSYAADLVERDGAQLTVQLASDHAWGFFWRDDEIRTMIAAADLIGPVYGTPLLPPLRYTFAKHAPAPAWALPFLDPAPPTVPGTSRLYRYRLINSLTNWLPDTGAFSIIGGELSYTHQRGWAVTLHPGMLGGNHLDPAGDYTLGSMTGPNSTRELWLVYEDGEPREEATLADIAQINRPPFA